VREELVHAVACAEEWWKRQLGDRVDVARHVRLRISPIDERAGFVEGGAAVVCLPLSP
jgi:hypothetical protein